jgi:hypothetical protein
MSLKGEGAAVLDAVDLLFAETRHLRSQGVCFRIVHRLRRMGTICAPGEEVAAIFLMHHGREYRLRIPLSLRLLFDFLAHSRFPQSASQIEIGMRTSQFYIQHGANGLNGKSLTRSFAKSSIRVYVQRLRRALSWSLREAGLQLDVERILVSQATVSNETGYRIIGVTDWVHIDLPQQ